MTSRWQWLTWDGLLPLVAVGLPWAISWFVSAGTIEALSLLFAILLAFLRAVAASEHLKTNYPKGGHWTRHVVMAGAIVVLMVFDVAATYLLHVLPQMQPPAQLRERLLVFAFTVGLYVTYGLLAAFALRPCARVTPSLPSTSQSF